MEHLESMQLTAAGVPSVATKPAPSPIERFFRERCNGDAGEVNLPELFAAIGGMLGALEALRRSFSGREAAAEPVAETPASPTVAPPVPSAPVGGVDPTLDPPIEAAAERATIAKEVAGASKLKHYATAGAIVIGGHAAGFVVGTKVSDVQHALRHVVPEVVCVDSPPPNSDAKGYLRIGPADAQTAETILPLQPNQTCASRTVELSMHFETTLNPPDGACVDVRLSGEAVRSYVTLNVKEPFVDLRLQDGTQCESSKNTLVTERPLQRSSGLDR